MTFIASYHFSALLPNNFIAGTAFAVVALSISDFVILLEEEIGFEHILYFKPVYGFTADFSGIKSEDETT